MKIIQIVTKCFVPVALLMLAIPTTGQLNENQRHGQFGVGMDVKSKPKAKPAPALPADGNIFRCVTGQVFNIQKSLIWMDVSGDVEARSGNFIILQRPATATTTYSFVALKNYSGAATSGRHIRTPAMKTGTYTWGELPLDVWDCGTPYESVQTNTNRPMARARTNAPVRAVVSGLSPAQSTLNTISNQVALLDKQVAAITTKADTEIKRLLLQEKANVITPRQRNDAVNGINKNTDARTKPVLDKIAKLKLDAFEVRQRYGIPEPAKVRRR